MVERDRVYGSKFKLSGMFDFKAFYSFVYAWLNEYKYQIIEEKSYNEKIKPEGKEIDVHWEARKKISDYFRFMLKVDWLVLGMTTVEVEKNGVKVKMNMGVIELNIVGYLEKDYEHRWETTAVSKFLRGIYDRYIIKNRIEDYNEKIVEEIDELVAQAKSYLMIEGKVG